MGRSKMTGQNCDQGIVVKTALVEEPGDCLSQGDGRTLFPVDIIGMDPEA